MTTPLITAPTYSFNNNLVVNGSVSATNVSSENRIINGDMRVDQRGDDGANATGALTGSNLTYKVPPPSYYTVDRFAISAPNVGNPVVKKVNLSTEDTLATGGFTTAAQISPVPMDSLMAYFPFENSVSDVSGQNVALTVTGTAQYVPSAVVGSTALYLANEANVNAGTAAANRITCPNFVFPRSFSVSMWALNRGTGSTIGTINSYIFTTNTTSTINNSLGIQYFGSLNGALSGYITSTIIGVNTTSTIAPTLHEWSHIVLTFNLGVYQTFVNGISYGTNSGTFLQSGFMLGNTSPSSSTNPFAGYIDDFRIYNRVLGPSEISALAFNIGIPMAPPVDASWITQLTLDNTVVDSRGGLPDPVRRGNTVFTPVCKTGSFALDLSANNAGGFATSTATTALTYTLASGNYNVPITLMGWFNAVTVTKKQTPMCIGNNTGVNSFSLQIQILANTTIAYEFEDSSGLNFISIKPALTLNPGTWYHVALSASSTPTNTGYIHTYLNGRLVASQNIVTGGIGTNGGTGLPTQLRIGAQTGTNIGFNFQGFVDDVRIYNKALTSRDIAGIYASSQYASYTLFKQPIEANNIHDLAWGTPSAQPITASMWIKNNTSNAQSFSVSVQNAGANMIAWIPFENGSVADVLGFLNNSSNYAVPLSTSVYKVGTASLDLSANTVGGTSITSRRVDYNVPFALQQPLSVSFWLYSITPAPGGGIYQVPFSLGSYQQTYLTELVIAPTGNLYVDNGINNTSYQIGTTNQTLISANTWYHICITYGNGLIILYINGLNVNQVTYPANGVITWSAYGFINHLRIGNQNSSTSPYAFKGYIDDFRIYNVALSQSSVAQLYANNANTTASSTYLLPRSVVYNPPPIPANTWQKIVLTIPGETTSSFLPNNDTGLTLALCLGSSDLYNTGNLASSTNNTSAVWNTVPEYTGASNQLYGLSDSNFLAYVTNSILITGVQLEKGTLATPFNFRPYEVDLALAQRYYQQIGGIYPATLATGFVRAASTFIGFIPISIPLRTNVYMTTTPGISLNISHGGGDATVTSIGSLGGTVPTYYISTNIATPVFGASGLSVGVGGLVTINGTSRKVFLIFDAEL